MKNSILLYIIGVLFGAVITMGAFFVFTSSYNNVNLLNNSQMNGRQPPEMSSGQNNNTSPDKLNDNINQNSTLSNS